MAGMVVVFVFMPSSVRSNISFQLRADLSPNNLECLTVEINKPRSKPFLVYTWFRPPQSSRDLFSTFERILIKLTLKTWSYILWVSLAVMDANSNSSKPAVKRR